ncbi:MAG: trypsin-like peptidase domain-containing protein [Planctomycetota bacterium]
MTRLAVCVLLLLVPFSPSLAQDGELDRRSVVKVFATARTPNLFQPWTRNAPVEGNGSGVIIAGNRIITNAHVVNYASRILVQPHQSSDRYEAEVVAIARGIDLAVLELEDESFFDEYPAATLSERLPRVGSTVTALGYPLGGDAMSVTEGVVSRIEHTGYNGETLGLRIQVDVAINPGNSGGPVFLDGEVVGLVFSRAAAGENIGYVIPTEEVKMFLDDAADGTYDGKPRLFLRLQTAENRAIRERLGLSREDTGLIVTDPGLSDELQTWDVITAIGPHDVDNVGMVDVPGEGDLRLHFGYFVPKLAGESTSAGVTVPLTVIRGGEPVELDLAVSASRDVMIGTLDGEYPSYVVYGPMVFTPAYQELLRGAARAALPLASNDSPLIRHLTSMRRPGELEELVIVPAPFFPHRLTKGYELGLVPVVERVNGEPVRSLAHLVELLESNEDEYTVFEFGGTANEILVFETEALRESTEEVLDDAGIRRQASPDVRGLLR